ncbi:hypothetical protein KNU79_gp61 [Gordonia phage NadineRae]|uniref:Uncharacterized protein n=1 Tax=Gordonia phage NadineRae TaxID=2652882 RepID=A0A5P8DFI9_9CAUD|nr:hypothetical protein KNU79_gp61 [Gordonia phage NadineRae]QFP97744.1 hypothetical protein SEA_NADINERAE_61 [Gordonia phage NadineRae]
MAQHERTGRVGEVIVTFNEHLVYLEEVLDLVLEGERQTGVTFGPAPYRPEARAGRHRRPEINVSTRDDDACLRELQASAVRSKMRVLRG